MDHQQGGCIVESAKYYQLMKKTLLQFVILLSFFSFLHSYFSGFPYNLHFSTLVFQFFAQALDRKYMFLICNGILAFLAKNLTFSSSSGLAKNVGDGVTELPVISKEANVAAVEYAISTPDTAVAEEEEMEQQQQQQNLAKEIKTEEEEEKETKQQQQQDAAKEMKTEDIMLENEDWDEEEEEDDEVQINKTVEEVNDARVSTEELNKKFEEFIRKMKEEIRIEAQQQLIQV